MLVLQLYYIYLFKNVSHFRKIHQHILRQIGSLNLPSALIVQLFAAVDSIKHGTDTGPQIYTRINNRHYKHTYTHPIFS